MILVTGATGFIGRQVCALGTHRAFVRRPRGVGEEAVGDIRDVDALVAALEGVEAVVHLAALNVDRDGQGYDAVNVGGAEALLEAMARRGVRRLLGVSSAGVYGHERLAGATEDTPLAPDTPFSRSKAAADELLLRAHAEGRVELTLLRHRFVYGPGDASVLPRVHRATQRTPFLLGGGSARLSLVYVGDLARLAWRLVQEPEPRSDRPVYHVTDGQPTAYRDLAAALCDRLGGQLPRLSLPYGLVHGALRLRERLLGVDPELAAGLSSLRVALVGQDNWVSSERLQARLPGWRPTPLAEGLDASLAWYRSQLG